MRGMSLWVGLGVLMFLFSGSAWAASFVKPSPCLGSKCGSGSPSGAPAPDMIYLLGMSAAGSMAYLRKRADKQVRTQGK